MSIRRTLLHTAPREATTLTGLVDSLTQHHSGAFQSGESARTTMQRTGLLATSCSVSLRRPQYRCSDAQPSAAAASSALLAAVRWQSSATTTPETDAEETGVTSSPDVNAASVKTAKGNAAHPKINGKAANATAKASGKRRAASAKASSTSSSGLMGAVKAVLKPVATPPQPPHSRDMRSKMLQRLQQSTTLGTADGADAQHPWRRGDTHELNSSDGIAFSDSAADLFTLDEERLDADRSGSRKNADDGDDGDDGHGGEGSEGSGQDFASPQSMQTKAAVGTATAEAALDMDEGLVDDPFHIPSVDDDALARDGGPAAGSVAAGGSSATARHASFAPNQNQVSEAVLASVDLLCDDLYHCKLDVLRSYARTQGVWAHNKAETVLRFIEKAHKAAHGENEDLSITRQVLGDVFDESVRTSGVRTAWTNKSLEASHVEIACERHLRFQMMTNASKKMMVRSNVAEASRVLRKLTRIFHEEQEQLSLVAVGGVFRTYRAEADELVHSLPITEIVSPFAAFLVSYVRYGSSRTTLTRQNVNDRLVQLEAFQPTIQEMDDTSLLQRLMDMLDPAILEVERASAAAKTRGGVRSPLSEPYAYAASMRAFSETSHAQWNTGAAPDWVHDLARLFCNWEAIVRTDLPRFADVPRHFFDCVLSGVTEYYVLQRIYGEYASAASISIPARQSLKIALIDHLSNEDNAVSALQDLMAYVQPGSGDLTQSIRGEFFVMVLSQMQGAFRDTEAERSALHDERVAVILRALSNTTSNCTRSHSLFELLVQLTADLHFHLRFQCVFKKLSSRDRKVIRTKPSLKLQKTLTYFESEFNITPISAKAVGFLVVQLLYLALRGDGSKRPVLERFASVAGTPMLDVVGLTEVKAVNVRDLRFAFPPQLSYNSWLNESDTREKSVYNVMPSVAVKGSTNQAMIVSQAPMMKALDAISRVPWRINKYMLHVQEAIVREGFGFGKIRPGFYPLHYYSHSDGSIQYPSDRRRSSALLSDDNGEGDDDDDDVFNIQQRREYQLQLNADWKNVSELRSNRIHYLQALRQARSILQFSHIYFPNSMDFRGRMYPLPGRLNHTGSDPFRGLLEYAEPKPLGAVGLYWLKVHLANKMGMSKLSFDERVHYVNEHMEDVVQSAESPLQGDRWWQEASEPLQCLMACKEVASAMKCSQGPENFLSRLPVAVDGSYNGLQHYSAIGRDAFGASLVNLIPSERPADAYTGILKEMLKSIHADAARDHQVAQRCLGTGKGQDTDHIKRKTIKRPIMTQVYGVTAYGMSEQIFDELQKQNKSHGLWTHTDMKEMAAYLRDKVLESLGVTFRETQNCRKWISEVVQLIWSVQPPELRNALCWTTPLGLVVRQPYRMRNECSLFTTGGYARIAGDAIAPASRKQLTAIAPNLIHSLDATHLAMTALEMQHQGLSMMAVHDSYWTYACDLPKLSQVLREQFVNLYSRYDPLWELKEQWEETYFMDLRRHGVKLPEPPKRGDLDLNMVLQSPYFFS